MKTNMSGDVPFRLNNHMSKNRFKVSLYLFIIQIKRMLNIMMVYYKCIKWNNHVTLTWLESLTHHGFILNKSMIEWFDKYAPGFMCVGPKPHPFNNERHTICCVLTYILWRAQIA